MSSSFYFSHLHDGMGVGLIGSEHRTEMGMRVLLPTATHPNLYIFEGPLARSVDGRQQRACADDVFSYAFYAAGVARGV